MMCQRFALDEPYTHGKGEEDDSNEEKPLYGQKKASVGTQFTPHLFLPLIKPAQQEIVPLDGVVLLLTNFVRKIPA